MKLFLSVILSVLFILTVSGCGPSDKSSSEVKSSTSTTSDQQQRAQLKADLKKQADKRARMDAECRKVVQNAAYHQALGIITGIPACIAAIRSNNPAQVFLNCKDSVKLVGDLAKACLIGGRPSEEREAPSCFEEPEAPVCQA